MAKKTTENGHNRLEDAIATLINNQATFVAQLAESERLRSKLDREATERFTRIEGQMAEIIRVLHQQGQILEHLPDAVREKIGFKAPQ